MSSKHNDTNNTIHLGNYEEFFILYMDNELTPEQMNMVDTFLIIHPDLRGEFEMLMSTKLPAEEFNIIKDELYADNMQSSSVGEDLLSYIDNELDAEKTKIVELELAANSDYRLQHAILLQTKLDPSEKIAHPNKEELYRRTERVIAFKPWMRVAAAVLIIAISGIAYFNSSSHHDSVKPDLAAKSNPKQNQNIVKPIAPVQETNIALSTPATNSNSYIQTKENQKSQTAKELVKNIVQQPIEAKQEEEKEELVAYKEPVIEIDGLVNGKIGVQQGVNSSGVTSSPSVRTIDVTPEVADRQGSVKGFLRKATRLIEKRTGIDPTNDNGELLLGAVAVKLK